MKITLDIKYFFGSLIGYCTAFGTMTGYVQRYIHFAGAENEMAFCALSLLMAVGLSFASVEFTKPVKDGK
jgi:hypothetical protein